MLRYFTAGESHGEALVAFLSGLPAGLKVDQAFSTANSGAGSRAMAAAAA
jgi:chorismate synthase